jgi:biotin carboxylase
MNEQRSTDYGPASPKVLLTDTNRWALPARLAVALAECGCEVTAICPAPNHALMSTRAVQRTFRYSAFRPLDSLEAAIKAVNPDIVVPACDRSVGHLHELYARSKTQGSAGSKAVELIERSLGAPSSYNIVSSRYNLLTIARELGILVPDTVQVSSREELEDWSKRETLPWVVKADGTWGGVGVRVVESADKIDSSWRELTQIPRFARALKRMAVNRDSFLFRTWWKGIEHPLVVQSYIHGRPANCTVFADRGRVLAIIAVEVVSSEGSTGPANIVRVVENPQMKLAAEKLAARLELSGFFGLDFMIEQRSHAAHLIEMNPRLTPPCYLRLGKGRDLVGAMWAQLSGKPVPEHPSATEKELIAYHPQPQHEYEIESSYFHDVPHNEPELIRELLNPYPDRTILFRLVQYLNRRSIASSVFETSFRGSGQNFGDGPRGGGDCADDELDSPVEKAQVR